MATIEINDGVTSMTLLLFIGSVIFALAGLIFFSAARGAVHETAALVLFLTSAVMLVGATLNNAANRIIDVLRERLAAPSRMTQPAADQPDTEHSVARRRIPQHQPSAKLHQNHSQFLIEAGSMWRNPKSKPKNHENRISNLVKPHALKTIPALPGFFLSKTSPSSVDI